MFKSYLLEILKQLSIDSLLMIVDLYFIGFVCIYIILVLLYIIFYRNHNFR